MVQMKGDTQKEILNSACLRAYTVGSYCPQKSVFKRRDRFAHLTFPGSHGASVSTPQHGIRQNRENTKDYANTDNKLTQNAWRQIAYWR